MAVLFVLFVLCVLLPVSLFLLFLSSPLSLHTLVQRSLDRITQLDPLPALVVWVVISVSLAWPNIKVGGAYVRVYIWDYVNGWAMGYLCGWGSGILCGICGLYFLKWKIRRRQSVVFPSKVVDPAMAIGELY